MKKLIFLAVLCLLASASPMSAQLIISNNGHAEIGTNPNENYIDYVIASDVTAGYSIDSNRTNGDVIVKNGVEYEVEASGTVTLEDGFKVEKGATFAVYPASF